MGAQVSKVSVVRDIVNKSVSKTVSEIGQTCSMSSSNDQLISYKGATITNCSISGIGNILKQNVDFKCLQKGTNTTDFTETLKKNIVDNLKAATTGIGGIYSETNVQDIEKDVNDIFSEIDLTQTTECIQKVGNSQQINFDYSTIVCPPGEELKNITNDITGFVAASCTQDTLNKVVSKLENLYDSKIEAAATVAGLNPAEFFAMIAGLIVVVILIGVFIFLFYTGRISKLFSTPFKSLFKKSKEVDTEALLKGLTSQLPKNSLGDLTSQLSKLSGKKLA